MGILTSIGQGDRYLKKEFEKWNLDPRRVSFSEDGLLNYNGSILLSYRDDMEKLPFRFGKVEGGFQCKGCRELRTLQGAPTWVGGSMYINECTKLESLEGCPIVVEGAFSCGGCNKLTTLQGGPRWVGGWYVCKGCEGLKTLKGSPIFVGKWFSCSNCEKLETIKDLPYMFKGTFYYSGSDKVKETIEEVMEMVRNVDVYNNKVKQK